MKFIELCRVLDDIKTKKVTKEKEISFETLFSLCRKEASTENETKTKFYSLLRLILPGLERQRSAYGLQEFSLRRLITNILCLKGAEASLLTDYRISDNYKSRDFCYAVYTILQKRYSNSANLNLEDINNHLDIISKKHAENDPRGQEQAFLNLFKLTSAEEQKWFLRIILNQVRIGLSRVKVLSLFHKDAPKLISLNNNLYEVCDLLVNPKTDLNELTITIFKAFSPMLSLRCDIKEFNKSVKEDKPFYIENKFDGERFQVHMKDGLFKYYSRRGYDFSSSFGENFQRGIFTPYVEDAFSANTRNFILDGEMMGWNKTTKSFGSKGMHFDVKKLTTDTIHQPCFCVFDILLLNDEIITNRPLSERKAILNSVIKPIEGYIQISECIKTSGKQAIIHALNATVDKGEEGIVFKEPSSVYLPNERYGWWKFKLEYFEDVMSDLDVLIIGGYYPTGSKDFLKISEFLVGVLDKNTSKYFSFARISSGLDRNELATLHQQLGGYWIPLTENGYEDFYTFSKVKPDVWIKPVNSVCVLVRASELIKSYGANPDYKCGYTLRFPRIQALRFDKPVTDCLTMDELQLLTKGSSPVQKLSKRHLDLGDLQISETKQKRSKRSIILDCPKVEVQTSILENYEFYVLTGKDEWNKEQVELAIRQNKGRIVRHEGPNTLCMLAGDDHMRIKTYRGDTDIVNVEWLKNVIDRRQFEMYNVKDMIYFSDNTRKKIMSIYDKYTDPYIKYATKSSLEFIIDNVFTEELEKVDYVNPTSTEIREFNSMINFEDHKNKFLGYSVYFDKYKIINDHDTALINDYFSEEINFKFRGGISCDYLKQDTQFVITNKNDEDRAQVIEIYLKEINCNAKVLRNIYEIFNMSHT